MKELLFVTVSDPVDDIQTGFAGMTGMGARKIRPAYDRTLSGACAGSVSLMERGQA